jgi:hypothetical protein
LEGRGRERVFLKLTAGTELYDEAQCFGEYTSLI